jgi:hypothetical protein
MLAVIAAVIFVIAFILRLTGTATQGPGKVVKWGCDLRRRNGG